MTNTNRIKATFYMVGKPWTLVKDNTMHPDTYRAMLRTGAWIFVSAERI